MFLESLIATFLLGALVGALIGARYESRFAQRHIAYYRGRSIRHLGLAEQARKPHLGTPYLRRQGVEVPLDVPTPLPLDVAYALTDPHSGSRRADVLEERANVVPMQVQTGRPA